MKKALVVFSGGQDSVTCLAWAKQKFDYVETLSFDYRQKNLYELKQAKKIAKLLDVKNYIFKTDILKLLNDSSLISDDIINNKGIHHNKKHLPSSFVPNRNAIFFSIAHAYAQKNQIENIVIGINQADVNVSPDCKKEFIETLEKSLNIGSDSKIKFYYPLIDLKKEDIFELALKYKVLDLIINESYTCYENKRTKFEWGFGCAKCNACLLRKKGFETFLKKKT